MMAEWWDFTPADLQRVGLVDAPHPEREYRTPVNLSWSDAFASFLDEASGAEDRFARPPPRGGAPAAPAGGERSPSHRAPSTREASLSESALAEPPLAQPAVTAGF